MKFCIIKCILPVVVLLLLNISNSSASNCEEQIIQLISSNQILTQTIAYLTEKIDRLDARLMKFDPCCTNFEPTLDNHKIASNRIIKKENHSVIDDWIAIQRRKDGSENFFRHWAEYEKGFGQSDEEFFIGLMKLHELTNNGEPMELLIVLEDFEGNKRYANYDHFVVGDQSEKYELKHLGNYSGTAGDSLSYHLGQKWSTTDQENDANPREHCAVSYTGAWWYNGCHRSNLNGRYLRGELDDHEYGQGIHWNTFRGFNYSLKFVEMKIRPKHEDADYRSNKPY